MSGHKSRFVLRALGAVGSYSFGYYIASQLFEIKGPLLVIGIIPIILGAVAGLVVRARSFLEVWPVFISPFAVFGLRLLNENWIPSWDLADWMQILSTLLVSGFLASLSALVVGRSVLWKWELVK